MALAQSAKVSESCARFSSSGCLGASAPSATVTDDPSKLNQPGNEVRLIRVDITSGAATVWFRRTGTLVVPLGVEPDSSALVLVNPPVSLWLVAGTGIERQVALMGASTDTVSDSHGVWLSNNGIWLAAPNGEVLAVSSVSGTPAGACS